MKFGKAFKIILAAALLCGFVCIILLIDGNDDVSNIPVFVETGSDDTDAPPPSDAPPLKFVPEDVYYSAETLYVTIESENGGKIYYTMDGTRPNLSSNRYIGPIKLIAGEHTEVKVISACTVLEDGTLSETINRSFFIGADVESRFDVPVFSIITDPYNLYDYEYGIFIEGKLRDEFIANNPKAPIYPSSPANFNIKGMAGERRMFIQIFSPSFEILSEQNGGLRTYGGWSRARAQKSVKILARSDYDIRNKFTADIFCDNYSDVGKAITEYKRIVLRNCGNDHDVALIRDELIQRLSADAGFSGTEKVTAASLYINGDYFGFYWAHENYCDDYFKSHYGSFAGTFAVLDGSEASRSTDDTEIRKSYFNMYNYCRKDLTDDTVYAELCKLLDVRNYLSYYAINILVDNVDWPMNNNICYRYIAPSEDGYTDSMPFDGRWRFLIHDTDFSTGIGGNNASFNTYTSVLKESPLFAALMARKDCRDYFFSYTLDLLNGAFSEENVNSVIEDMVSERENELFYHLKYCKYAPNITDDYIARNVEKIRKYFISRRLILTPRICEEFLSSSSYILEVDIPKGAGATVNTISLSSGTFTGNYCTALPVTLNPILGGGREFAGWEVNGRTLSEKMLVIEGIGNDISVKLLVKDVT